MAKKNLFTQVKVTKPPRNVFDLSHDVKLSLNMGQLVPIMCTECVPGDKFTIGCESLVRMAPMIAPMMHRLDVTMHYFFVPNRIVWPNWEKFISNTKLEETGELPAFPTLTINDVSYTPLCDYMGIPAPPAGGLNPETVSALAFAAYQCCYSEMYRDQNLIDPVNYKLVDGSNDANDQLLELRLRAWEHDYFTSALPWAQKGDPVTLPVAGQVTIDPTQNNAPTIVNPLTKIPIAGDVPLHSDTGYLADNAHNPVALDPNGTLEVSNVESTINDLRTAFRLQEWLEKAARAGSRYIEVIKSHFGVNSSDARLQRPEYITGIKSPIIVSEVLQTSETIDSPQGNMAGHGVGVIQGQYGSHFCEEHGYIIGIMSVMPKTAYQQGIPRHFLKTDDPFQYYWLEFANIGEQEITNKELYAYQGPAVGNAVFGYIPRYAEYKFENNRVAGEFRSTLNYWHMGRIFDTLPQLSREFIECDPTTRVFAVTDPGTQKMYAQVYNKVKASRLMPYFGTPTF